MSTAYCAPWIDPEDISTPCNNPTVAVNATTLSSALLFRFSGRQYPGICTRTIRPCMSSSGCGGIRGQFPLTWDYPIWDAVINDWTVGTSTWPIRMGDQWFNIPACGGHCHLPTLDNIPGPIAGSAADVVVVIDGVVLDPTAYRVSAGRTLKRVDGGTWPCSQSFSLDSTIGGDKGTWQVTYPYGKLPTDDGIVANKIYAEEIAKYLCGQPCNLPQRVKEISREGVQVILDPLTHIANEETGIPLVDLWLRSVNGQKLKRRSTISRLDVPPNAGRMA